MNNERQQDVEEMVNRFQSLGFNVSLTSSFGNLYKEMNKALKELEELREKTKHG